MKTKNYLEQFSDKEFKEKYGTSLATFFKRYPSDGAEANLNIRLSLFQAEHTRRENEKSNRLSLRIAFFALFVSVSSLVIGVFK